MSDNEAERPKRNLTIPELPEKELSLMEAIQALFEPPIPTLREFIEDGWWETTPDTPEAEIKTLWFRYRQTGAALAVALKKIVELDARIDWLEAHVKSSLQ